MTSTPDHSALQRRTLTVLIITQVLGTVGVGIAPSIGILLAEDVTGNEALAGLARTSSTLGAALFGLPLGTLAARHGRRFALSLGWLTAALGSALLVAAAQNSLVVALFAGLLLIGAGSAASLQSRFAATDLAEPHHRARALAFVVWVGTVGSVLGPNLGVPGSVVGSWLGLNVYAGAFGIATVCMAGAAVVVVALLRPDPLLVLRRESSSSDGVSVRPGRRPGRFAAIGFAAIGVELRTNPRARYAVTAILTAQVVMVAVMTMTPVHIAHHGGSITLVGITISLHVLGMFALSPLVGWFADRFGHRVSIGLGLLVLLASLVTGALWPDSMRAVVVCLFLLGLGWSFVSVAGSALFATVIADDHRAAAQGGVDALANLCGAVAALGSGPLLVATNFSVLSLVAVVALVPLAVVTLRG
ncbi:MFS transporter [Aestuariimicrobium soli]|uniref:MFS transporter n=1 Tax=Aestuariimicrobium soli TaxID=2035834 RepID=UPI003EBD9406